MRLAKGATVAVIDGQKLSLFRNTAEGMEPRLQAEPVDIVTTDRAGGVSHSADSGHRGKRTADETSFAADVAEHLNKEAIAGRIKEVLVIAAPKTLGELRKHYHAKLKDALAGEIAKDLTGQTSDDIETAIAAA